MRLDQLHEMLSETLEAALADKDLTEEEIASQIDRCVDEIPPLADELAEQLYGTLKRDRDAMLRSHRRQYKGFLRKHYRLWHEGLKHLQATLVSAYELGDSFNSQYRREGIIDGQTLHALTRIHARAVHVGYEVLTLMASGFADGAHARWRTLHELSCVANLLAEADEDLSTRYLDHEVIESYRAMIQYQKYADALGMPKYTDQEIQTVEKHKDELVERYGRDYLGPYGWCARHLGKRKPNMADIEESAGLEHMRPYYRMASHNVHANPKGASFRLGASAEEEILLAGPSNFGLADPGHGAAIAVAQATVPLLNLRPNLDTIVYSKILLRFADDVGAKLLHTHRKMEPDA